MRLDRRQPPYCVLRFATRRLKHCRATGAHGHNSLPNIPSSVRLCMSVPATRGRRLQLTCLPTRAEPLVCGILVFQRLSQVGQLVLFRLFLHRGQLLQLSRSQPDRRGPLYHTKAAGHVGFDCRGGCCK